MVLTFVCYSAGRYKVEYFLCIIAVLFTLIYSYSYLFTLILQINTMCIKTVR